MILALIGLTAYAWSQMTRVGSYRLRLTSTPSQVPADGKSEARIRIEVRTQSGSLTTDDPDIVVRTSLGALSDDHVSWQQSVSTRTSGGVGVVYLTSETPGNATVTAQVRDSREIAYIRFFPESEEARAVSRVIHVSGEWVGYSVDTKAIEASGDARARLGDLSINATDMVRVDTSALTIQASDAVISIGDSKLEARQLYFDVTTRRGVLRRFSKSGIERMYFSGFDLSEIEPWDVPDDAFKHDYPATHTWLVAEGVSYFIGEKVVIRHGSMWIDNDKVLSFPPLWVIGLPGYRGTTNTEMLQVDSGGDLDIDVPFFYNVGETDSQAVKLQRGRGGDSASASNKWALGWEHEYRTRSDDVEGSVELSGLPRDNWGVRWQDERMIWGDASSYLNVASPDHRSLYADLSVYDYTESGRINYRTYYDAPRHFDSSYGISGDWLSNSRPAFGDNRYRLGVTMGLQHDPALSGLDLKTNLFGELNFGYQRLGSDTVMRPVLSNYFVWDTGGYQSNAVRLGLDFDHRISWGQQLGLRYSIEHYSGDANVDGIEQILDLDYSINRRLWYLYLNASQNLTFGDRYGFLSANYYPNPEWHWEVAGTYYDFQDDIYNEWELSLARMFGAREIGLSYSEETNRFSLELGGFTNF